MTAHFLFHGIDRDGTAEQRQQLREDHRVSIRRSDPHCRCILGGPLRDAEGAMIGTALVFVAADAAAVRTFMAPDPYLLAGLFERVEVRRWTIGLGAIA
jgi:uncharacterized protein YciI